MSVEYVPKRYNQSIIDSIPNTGTDPIIVAVLDTGVDPMAYGLQQCPDGTPKVIDVIDCTKSDIVEMSETKLDLVPISVRKILDAKIETTDDTLTILMGTRSLRTFISNRKYKELNDEQKKVVDDVILNVYTYKRDDLFRVIIENYSDDELLEYHVNYQCGKIVVGYICFYFAVHVYNDGKEVSLVFDSGAHGTHVAGIIGGYFPDKPEQNGINPNARILSLKIGDTRVDGMETSEALCRALDEMVKYKCTLANYSFGETVIPTDTNCSDMTGRFIEKLNQYVEKYNIVFVTSAGNSGPQLMTIGAPGVCTENCIVVGAYTDHKMLDDLYFLSKNGFTSGLYHWSSCGPKYNKSAGVDLMAPGCALTSHPHWYKTNMNFCNGTSMARPNAVGIMSLVLEKHTNCARDIPFYWIKKYFENSCYAQPHIASSAQGNGLIMSNLYGRCNKQIESVPYHYEVTNGLNAAHVGSFIHVKRENLNKDALDSHNVLINIVPKFKNSLDGFSFRKTLVLRTDFDPDGEFVIGYPCRCIVDSQGTTVRVGFTIPPDFWDKHSSLDGYVRFVDPITNMFVASYYISIIISSKINYEHHSLVKIGAGNIHRTYCRFEKNTAVIRLGNIKKYKYKSLIVGFKDLTEYRDISEVKYFSSKNDMKQHIRFNCVPYTLYEIIVYLPWNAGTDCLTSDITLKLINYNTIISIPKSLLLVDEQTSINVAYDDSHHKKKHVFETPFVPTISHIESQYLPVSENIIDGKLVMIYNLNLHDGINKYYVNFCNKVYNSKVTSGANLFGLFGGKIMFMGNYVPKKYDGIVDQIRIEIADSDTKVLEEYKQMVLCVERQPKKPIDKISNVLSTENGFMIDLRLPKSILANEAIYHDDLIHCKLRDASDEIITYLNKSKPSVKLCDPCDSLKEFCKNFKKLCDPVEVRLLVESKKDQPVLFEDQPYLQMLKGLTYHEQSDSILKELESNKLMDSAPFCAYEWLQYIHTNVDASKNVYDSIERTKKHIKYWSDLTEVIMVDYQLEILNKCSLVDQSKRRRLEYNKSSKYGY